MCFITNGARLGCHRRLSLEKINKKTRRRIRKKKKNIIISCRLPRSRGVVGAGLSRTETRYTYNAVRRLPFGPTLQRRAKWVASVYARISVHARIYIYIILYKRAD